MSSNRPLFDIVIKRKDGAPFDCENYKGEVESRNSIKLGAIWPSKNDPEQPGSISFEMGALKAFGKLGGPNTFWVNVHNNDRDSAPKRGGNGNTQGGSNDGELF